MIDEKPIDRNATWPAWNCLALGVARGLHRVSRVRRPIIRDESVYNGCLASFVFDTVRTALQVVEHAAAGAAAAGITVSCILLCIRHDPDPVAA